MAKIFNGAVIIDSSEVEPILALVGAFDLDQILVKKASFITGETETVFVEIIFKFVDGDFAGSEFCNDVTIDT